MFRIEKLIILSVIMFSSCGIFKPKIETITVRDTIYTTNEKLIEVVPESLYQMEEDLKGCDSVNFQMFFEIEGLRNELSIKEGKVKVITHIERDTVLNETHDTLRIKETITIEDTEKIDKLSKQLKKANRKQSFTVIGGSSLIILLLILFLWLYIKK